MHDLWNYILKEKCFWNVMVYRFMHMFSEIFMIYYDTKYFDTDRIYALSLTMFQWAPPMGIIRWYSVDPASGGCALVFCGPRQWGLNVGHSRGCWVTSVLNRIGFMIILYVNIWKYLISMKYTLMFICSIILENYIISELSSWDICYLLGCLAHYLSFYFSDSDN